MHYKNNYEQVLLYLTENDKISCIIEISNPAYCINVKTTLENTADRQGVSKHLIVLSNIESHYSLV